MSRRIGISNFIPAAIIITTVLSIIVAVYAFYLYENYDNILGGDGGTNGRIYWKKVIYQEYGHGFSFYIPNNWHIGSFSPQELLDIIVMSGQINMEKTHFLFSYRVRYFNNNIGTFKDWMSVHERDWDYDGMKKWPIVISNSQSFAYQYPNTNEVYYFIPRGKLIYEIHYESRKPHDNSLNEKQITKIQKSQERIAETIIDSFKFTDTTTSLIIDEWHYFSDDNIYVSFQYPEVWKPLRSDIRKLQLEEQIGINFLGSGGAKSGSNFSLAYSTRNFKPDKNSWLTKLVEDGLYEDLTSGNFCINAEDGSYPQFNIRSCLEAKIGGHQSIDFLTRTNSSDGKYTDAFMRVFIFETGNNQFPVGIFSITLPEVNKVKFVQSKMNPEGGYWQGFATKDLVGINNIFTQLEQRKTDQKTSILLSAFDRVINTLQFKTDIHFKKVDSLVDGETVVSNDGFDQQWWYISEGTRRLIVDWATGLTWGVTLRDAIYLNQDETADFFTRYEKRHRLSYSAGAYINTAWQLHNGSKIPLEAFPDNTSLADEAEHIGLKLGALRGVNPCAVHKAEMPDRYCKILDWSWSEKDWR